MIDIISVNMGEDLGVYDTSVKKAENVLSIQLGNLEYAPDFGIDLKYFLDENFQFQNESFKSYLIKRLSESNIDVASIVTEVNTLFEKYIFNITPTNNTGGLVR